MVCVMCMVCIVCMVGIACTVCIAHIVCMVCVMCLMCMVCIVCMVCKMCMVCMVRGLLLYFKFIFVVDIYVCVRRTVTSIETQFLKINMCFSVCQQHLQLLHVSICSAWLY